MDMDYDRQDDIYAGTAYEECDERDGWDESDEDVPPTDGSGWEPHEED